jgi:hypothetical protein
MALIQGVIDKNGTVIRRQGNFTIITAFPGQITIEVPGQTLDNDFILATPWSNIGDALGGSHIAAIVGFPQRGRVLFEVSPGFGVSFRIQT